MEIAPDRSARGHPEVIERDDPVHAYRVSRRDVVVAKAVRQVGISVLDSRPFSLYAIKGPQQVRSIFGIKVKPKLKLLDRRARGS
jgi:hypothetical protein